jgi:hypothetical protein
VSSLTKGFLTNLPIATSLNALYYEPFKDEMLTALFKEPVRTAL